MAESYAALAQKYRRLIDHLRQVEQERDEIRNSYEELKRSNAKVEKSTKYLCETILKKAPGNKDEKAWFKMPLEDMVDKAQDAIEAYFPSVQKLLGDMLKHNSERTKRISELEAQLESERKEYEKKVAAVTEVANEKISKLAAKAITGKTDQDEINKIVGGGVSSQKQSIDLNEMDETQESKLPSGGKIGDTAGKVSFETEEKDSVGDNISDAVDSFREAGDLIIPVRMTPEVKVDSTASKKAAEKITSSAQEEREKAKALTQNMSDAQKLIIRTMGETGASEAAAIIKTMRERYDNLPGDSTIRSGMRDLVQKTGENDTQIVEAYKIPVPGSSNFCVYKLTKTGRQVYRYLFSKEPALAEMDAIVKAHTSLEHGYGIKKTALMIEKMKFAQDPSITVTYMTRSKEYAVDTGNGTSYVPDIVISKRNKDGSESRSYIEYETGKCADNDFISKCNKIASFQKHINIIVATNEARDETLRKIDKWRTYVSKDDCDTKLKHPVAIRVSTFTEARSSQNQKEANGGIPWMTTKTISPSYLRKNKT